MSVLEVSGLTIAYPDAGEPIVRDAAFKIARGESLGIVGESGSGKTQTALAIMGLLPANAICSGHVLLHGEEILGSPVRRLNSLRPQKMAMVFQDPMAALNPYLQIGTQLKRILVSHRIATGAGAATRALDMLRKVGLSDPERQFRAYPHQLSGGMRQRALIAAALIAEPDLLIADEPTTALDVTIQAQILQLLQKLRQESNTALLLITHDLGVVAGNCERMLIMDHGRVLECGTTGEVFASPEHSRTRTLIAATPRLDEIVAPAAPTTRDMPLLEVDDLAVSFRERRGGRKNRLRAVLPASFSVLPGETLAVVGESGSGKTSLVRAALGLLPRESGTVGLLGMAQPASVRERSLESCRQMQMVFQDPVGSLNPAMRIGGIIKEPLGVHEPASSNADRLRQVSELMERVGLDPLLSERYPHELSGGQAQRVAIARALILQPKVLICDEAVAALDGTVRRDILALLLAEQRRLQFSLIIITHDLGVVRQMSHRVLVMYMGRFCELASNDHLFRKPEHPYTKVLLDAMPVADPAAPRKQPAVAGEVSSLLHPPAGCVFHPRCPFVIERCSREIPALLENDAGKVACHRSRELDLSS